MSSDKFPDDKFLFVFILKLLLKNSSRSMDDESDRVHLASTLTEAIEDNYDIKPKRLPHP